MLKERILQMEKDNTELRKVNNTAVERIRSENGTLKMEVEVLRSENKELHEENLKLENNEDLYLTQVNLKSQELDEVRKQLRQLSPATIKQHIKSSLLNWLESLSKAKKDEASSIFLVLINQLEISDKEKNEVLTAMDKLKIRKKMA